MKEMTKNKLKLIITSKSFYYGSKTLYNDENVKKKRED